MDLDRRFQQPIGVMRLVRFWHTSRLHGRKTAARARIGFADSTCVNISYFVEVRIAALEQSSLVRSVIRMT